MINLHEIQQNYHFRRLHRKKKRKRKQACANLFVYCNIMEAGFRQSSNRLG